MQWAGALRRALPSTPRARTTGNFSAFTHDGCAVRTYSQILRARRTVTPCQTILCDNGARSADLIEMSPKNPEAQAS